MYRTLALSLALVSLGAAGVSLADPCGMVPPVYIQGPNPIARVGDQNTFVFYKDGVETFIIRPGFTGKADEFGMLIPFPAPPAVRKVPDAIFPHVAAAIDPPEVVVYANVFSAPGAGGGFGGGLPKRQSSFSNGLMLQRDEVRVLKEEAVGMYEVAVLEAGSSAALKKWMEEHKYKYPDGMDKVCDEYVDDRWCFVAVKTKVGDKQGADPGPGARQVDPKLPKDAMFDGHVQAMGFRFETEELVVPMRLSAFNEGELHNVVFLLTDSPKKIRSIPEEYVVRQISGEDLHRNVTDPLPVRVVGGTVDQIPEWQLTNLPQRRDPEPHNGHARDLFAGDLLAVQSGKLSLPHEEAEKQLLRIGEHFRLRGAEVDKLNLDALAGDRKKAARTALGDLKKMSLTVIDGDFPREVLASKNLAFAEYKMPARRNKPEFYDVKSKQPSLAAAQGGVLIRGEIKTPKTPKRGSQPRPPGLFPGGGGFRGSMLPAAGAGLFGLALLGSVWLLRRRRSVNPN